MRISYKRKICAETDVDLCYKLYRKTDPPEGCGEAPEISDKYLEQIISILNKAGFVRSVRGPQGGYALQQTPDKYTVGMILRLTEGKPFPCGMSGRQRSHL